MVCLSSQGQNRLIFFLVLFIFFKGQWSVVFVIILVLITFICGFKLKHFSLPFLSYEQSQLPNTVHFYLWPSQREALNLVLLFISEGSSSILTWNALKSKDGNKMLLSVTVIPLQILYSLKIPCLGTEECNLLCMTSYLSLLILCFWIFLITEVLMIPWFPLHVSKDIILFFLDKGNQTYDSISLNSQPAY